MKPLHDCVEGDRNMSNHYFKDMMTGDITVSSDTPVSSITISADYIRLESCVGTLPWTVNENCCYGGPEKTNCVNCGAPLSGKSLCRYCDTWNR